MLTPEEENEKYTKPCRVDGVTPCVQLPSDDDGDDCCDCADYCDECEVAIIYRNKNNCNLKEGKMQEYEKRALCDYAQTVYIIWESGKPEGLYKFWFPFTNFNRLKDEEFIPVHYYSGFGWKIHGKMTWEAVRKLVEAHRAGKRGTELGYVVRCEFFEPIWNRK